MKKYQQTIVDILLTKNGIKKNIADYVGGYANCPTCHKTYSPYIHDGYKKNQLYGHGFKAWIAYQRIALRLPYESIVESLQEQFNEKRVLI